MTGNIWRQLIILALLIAAMNYLYFAASPPQPEAPATISYSRFKAELEKGNIVSVTVQGETLRGTFQKPVELPEGETKGQAKPTQAKKGYDKFITTLPPFQDPELMKNLEAQGVDLIAKPEASPSVWTTVLVSLLPWVLILGLWWFLFRRMRNRGGPGGMLGNFAKSGAKLYSRENSKVTFDDVAGLEEAKQELQEIVEFLKDPQEVHPHRRQGAARNPAGRAAGNGQNPHGPGGGRRGGRPLFFHIRLPVHRDVRRRRCQPGARPLRERQEERAEHHLHR